MIDIQGYICILILFSPFIGMFIYLRNTEKMIFEIINDGIQAAFKIEKEAELMRIQEQLAVAKERQESIK